MLQNNDIIRYNNDLYVSQEYLVRANAVDSGYLRVAKSRANKGGQSWRYQVIANRCYFQYTALPKMAASKLAEVGTLASLATEIQDDIVNLVSKALYSTFKLFVKQMSDDEARSAGVIYEASIYIENNGISYRKSNFFEELAAEIDIQKLKYLPTTWRNLRDKIEAYANGTHIANLIYAKNRGNANHAMFTNNEQVQNWLVELADKQQNYSAATIYRKIQRMCIQHGVSKSPSDRWVREWLADPATQFLLNQRYGKNSRHNHKYRAYTPTVGAMYAGDCWDIDGTRVNIIDHKYKKMIIDKDGKERKVTTNGFLYIVAVRDVMSGLPLGWTYCHEESEEAVENALAMAVRNAGYLPYEIRYDRFPGHNTAEWMWLEDQLRRCGVTMTQTVKAEGKASTERWFGTLQSVFMAESDLYYGEGVKSTRKYAHRSKEYVAKMRQWATKNGFSFDDACFETNKILEAFISTPYSAWSNKYKKIIQSPIELHNECTRPYVFDISHSKFCWLFGLRKEVSIRNYMIQTQIDGATYYYGVDDCEVVEQYTGIKLWNCFDFENLDSVHLFDAMGNHKGTFARIIPAQQYGPNKDMRAVGKIKAIERKMNEYRAEKMKSYQAQELEETVLVESSPEVGIMQAGIMKKRDYEAAETAFLT
ncbi:transposase family protein, partial [Paludibacteraceae bacterium OttesenSCG-928-F17]|nr:transposase family protein [Paludibacteraceae bacterium OttesenSCG-928-F17]